MYLKNKQTIYVIFILYKGKWHNSFQHIQKVRKLEEMMMVDRIITLDYLKFVQRITKQIDRSFAQRLQADTNGVGHVLFLFQFSFCFLVSVVQFVWCLKATIM